MDIRHFSLDDSITSLPFENSQFDRCICTDVLEHIQDDNAAVAELARCLRPEARLLLSVPHPPAPNGASVFEWRGCFLFGVGNINRLGKASGITCHLESLSCLDF